MIATGGVATLNSETPWIAFFGDYFRREGMAAWLVYAIFFSSVLLLSGDQISYALHASSFVKLVLGVLE